MNPKVMLILNAFNLLPVDARDGIIDAVEKTALQSAAKTSRIGARIALNLFVSVLRHVREMTNTPDDDIDQLNPQ